jgi:mannosyltransferase
MLELDTSRAVAAGTPRQNVRLRHPAVLLGLAAALVGFAGSWIPSYWGDEAASVMSATRSWPSLTAMLGQIDGVHAVYYAFLHIWVGAFGTTELSTRLPSAIAVGLMVAGTVVLVRALASTKLAVLAGIICMVLPRTTYMATEARSYAIGSAIAVWVIVLLIRVVRPHASARVWLAYSIASAASMYVFLYLGLLLLVHGAFVLAFRRAEFKRWARYAATAALLATPILITAYRQRAQIDFLERRNYATPQNVLIRQWFGHPIVAVASWALILFAALWLAHSLIRKSRTEGRRRQLTALALAWVLIPTGTVLIGNALLAPMYNVRYLSFCTPGAAILIAVGAVSTGEMVPRRWRSTVTVAIIAAVVLACIPAYLGQRTPWAKDGGSDWRAVAAYVEHNSSAGGAVLFDQSTKPSRDPRIVRDLYPASFTNLHDVALEAPFTARPRLWDRAAANSAVAMRIVSSHDVWAIELPAGTAAPADITLLRSLGYSVESTERIHRTTVYHLVKG